MDELRTKFSKLIDTSQLIVREDMLINASDIHPLRRETILDVILEYGQSYPEFGESIPVQYQLLQEKTGEMRKNGQRIIPYTLLQEANTALESPLSADELELFVKFQHNCGFLLYFDDVHLRDFIILDPKIVIDATKCIVTSKMFTIETWDEEKWDTMVSTGKIDKSCMFAIWEKTSNDVLFEYREYLLLALQRLDIIAKPKVYDDGGDVSVGFFYIPCMLQAKGQGTKIKIKDADITISFKFKDLLPPAVVHKVFAACLGLWPVVANCLYDGWAVLGSGPNHLLVLRRESSSINVCVQHRQDAARIDVNRVRSIKHFLDQTIQRIVSMYGVILGSNTDKIFTTEYNQSAVNLGVANVKVRF